MALTPDDVVTKQFQHVRFKEGFDPDEVDDFLDEVVIEWRKTIAENEELKAKLAAYESGAAAPVAAESVPVGEPIVEVVPEPTPEPEVITEAPAPVAAVGGSGGAEASAGIIALAQRVHDEYVAEGEAARAKLLAEAESKAAQILADAEAKGRDEIARLEAERTTLEASINDLRQFESSYRQQLRGFIEEKLRDLDTTGTSSVSSS